MNNNNNSPTTSIIPPKPISNNGPKYIQFGEIKDDYDKAKLALTQEFPVCFSAISALFDCERSNGFKPTSSKSNTKNTACKNENAHLNFCILSSFCPHEALLLMECSGGVIPTDENKLPSKCLPYFTSFDNCLIRKTKEFEERDNKESTPISKVIYGDEKTNSSNNNNNNNTSTNN